MTYYAFEALDGSTLIRCVIAVNDSSKLPYQFRNWKLGREIDEHGEQPRWFNLSEVQAAIDRQGYWIKDYAQAAPQPPTTPKRERSALENFLKEPGEHKTEESSEPKTMTRKSSSKS